MKIRFPKKLPKLSPMSNYGDLFTKQDWISLVKNGCFIDYDGFGSLCTKNGMSEWSIAPSEYKQWPGGPHIYCGIIDEIFQRGP